VGIKNTRVCLGLISLPFLLKKLSNIFLSHLALHYWNKGFEKVEENLYLDPKGLVKSYWNADLLKKFIGENFESILLDEKGKTYKDSIRTLVRFVGKNIKPSP
jgi:hypothetical protein